MRIKALALASALSLISAPALAQVIIGGGGSGGGGTGSVVGPGSSTDGGITLFDGTTGQLLKDGGTLSSMLDGIGSTRGSVLYRGASGWTVLTPGTSGFFLKSNGAGADPTYAAAPGGGTVTSVATGNGLCGGPITTTGTISTCILQNAQTGTTYATLATDGGKLVSLSNASPVAVSLSQANQTGFTAGFATDFNNIGAGLVTVTATTSIFDDGATTLSVPKGQDAFVWSDGTNYHAAKTIPILAADTFLGNNTASATYGDKAFTIPSCANDGAHALVFASHALACASVTGSGSPGGSDTQFQYNNAGSFGGISTLAYDGATITNSKSGAASASAMSLTGVPFAGTGTTSTGLLLMGSGAASTTLSTSGTFIEINSASGSTASFLDFAVNGSATHALVVSSGGNLVAQGNVQASGFVSIGASGVLSWTGRGRLSSTNSTSVNVQDVSNNVFTTISNTGITFFSTIPVVTGTGSPTIVTGSSDTAGEVTAGASATSVIISFSATKTNAPFCVVTSQTQLAAFAYTISTTAITITQTATSGNKINYHCMQH